MPKLCSFWIHCYIQYMHFFGLYQYMHGPCVYCSMCSHIFLFYEVKRTKQTQSHSEIWFPLRSNYADMEFFLLLLETEAFSPVVSDFWFLLYDSCSNSLQEAPNHVPINYLIIFTFMHLADAFIQSDLQSIQAIHFFVSTQKIMLSVIMIFINLISQ